MSHLDMDGSGLKLARIDWRPIMQKGVLPDHDWKECMIDDVLIPAVLVYFCTLVQLTHVQRSSLIPTQLFARFTIPLQACASFALGYRSWLSCEVEVVRSLARAA